MRGTPVVRYTQATRWPMVTAVTIASVACATNPGTTDSTPLDRTPSAERTAPLRTRARSPRGTVTGALRFIQRVGSDTALGPVVVMLQPLHEASPARRVGRQIRIVSATDRFHPEFTSVRSGDAVVFVNGGTISHRLFSVRLGSDTQIPLRPESRSEPVPMPHDGEFSFFCSLHPEENFSVFVAPTRYHTVADTSGQYRIGALPDGAYRLSIWSRAVEGPVRVVEIAAGRRLIETIWLDPDLIGR